MSVRLHVRFGTFFEQKLREGGFDDAEHAYVLYVPRGEARGIWIACDDDLDDRGNVVEMLPDGIRPANSVILYDGPFDLAGTDLPGRLIDYHDRLVETRDIVGSLAGEGTRWDVLDLDDVIEVLGFIRDLGD